MAKKQEKKTKSHLSRAGQGREEHVCQISGSISKKYVNIWTFVRKTRVICAIFSIYGINFGR